MVTEQEPKAYPLSAHSWDVNELPQQYVPNSVPDLRPLEASRELLSKKLLNIQVETEQAEARMKRAGAATERRQKLLVQLEETQALKIEAAAESLINDKQLDIGEYDHQIHEISELLAASEKDCAAAERAVAILKTKVSELEARRKELSARLSTANREWLDGYRAHRMEVFRRGLHGLQTALADIIAIEAHRDFQNHGSRFVRPRIGMDFVQKVSSVVRLDSPMRPRWFDVRKSADFPGLADARARLDEAMMGDQR
ncbi:hypothetical protein QTL95_10230 [Rhizobium sp. S152]|uniref:hypothetical protein n=1 Tax=Rhizobium sp. S152 TaxID=3055038 RepID=UPI0025AA127A|nr:hypothetical protein [Rhizobium sp. S152]MDM9626275.1 hypothetical protein [Rhizobium sp. S152]